jgi:hypothetical protein
MKRINKKTVTMRTETLNLKGKILCLIFWNNIQSIVVILVTEECHAHLTGCVFLYDSGVEIWHDLHIDTTSRSE